MKKFLLLLSLLMPIPAAGQSVDKPAVPVYEGFTPLAIQKELAPRLIFTELPEDFAGLTCFDRRYVSVSLETAQRWIAVAFKQVDQTYVPELHDCEDKAFEMLVFLRREAMHTHPKMEWAVLAGMAAVKITDSIPELGLDGNGYHALVLVRAKGGIWWLVEPSTGKFTKLDEELFQGRLQLLGAWF